MSTNFLELKPQIYTYLGFRGVGESADVDGLIFECLNELESIAQFRYSYKVFDVFPEFLNKPPYVAFLKGCDKAVLAVMTLGAEADRKIKYLGRTDMTKSVVFDACSSALLEYLSDEYERNFGDDRTYRFCPGYGRSSVSDLPYIFELVKPDSIGVALTAENYMLPSKSMAGVIGLGRAAKAQKTCADCMLEEHCKYKAEGTTCYSAKKR